MLLTGYCEEEEEEEEDVVGKQIVKASGHHTIPLTGPNPLLD